MRKRRIGDFLEPYQMSKIVHVAAAKYIAGELDEVNAQSLIFKQMTSPFPQRLHSHRFLRDMSKRKTMPYQSTERSTHDNSKCNSSRQ